MLKRPAVVAHADWGSTAQKRAMAVACRSGSQGYRVFPPRLVNEPECLLADLLAEAGPSGEVLAGFDFPIGLPLHYANRIGIRDFCSFLSELGRGKWESFYQVAATPEEISLFRPFYPKRAGASKQSHLLEALGAASMDDLRRRCERAGADKYGMTHRAACPLFWTMGGQQVGKAALLGWKEVLVPALHSTSLQAAVWPFDGDLEELLQSKRLIIAETYPAEFFHHLGVRFSTHKAGTRSGKRVQSERAANAARLLEWARSNGIEIGPSLQGDLVNGFGNSLQGDDQFDAVVGLLGMLNILLGNHPCTTPGDEAVRRIEGWIMGKHVSVRPGDLQVEAMDSRKE